MNLDLTLFFGSLMSISFALCFAPQIYTMYKNKSSRDVSLGMVILQICGNIGGLGLAISTNGNIWLYINYGVGLMMALSLLFFWKLFRLNICHANKNGGPNHSKSVIHAS